jgi:dienelactone hydrolase
MTGSRRVASLLLALAATAACGSDPTQPSPAPTASPVSRETTCSAFVMSGDPRGPNGATWTYAASDGGTEYRLEGILLLPAGGGPFPGVVVSHGAGGLPSSYSARIGRVMVTWGLAVIATRYTHAANNDGRSPSLRPAGDLGASEANVSRALKARDLLGCLGTVDLTRVAAHGHSMGAFLTAQLLGRHPSAFRAGSHTAGGVSPGTAATQAEAAANIVVPYQIHHGDQDTVVPLAFDQTLDRILTERATRHELYVYAGFAHDTIAADPTMLERVRTWYTAAGVLP